MEASTQHPPPPDPPELPAGAARFPAWPPWFAVVGFLVGLSGTLLFAIVLGVVATLFGADTDSNSPAVVVIGTVAQGVAFVIAAVFFASRVTKPRAWHFGLMRTRFWPALGWAAAGMVAFYFVTAIYGVLVQPEVEQDTVEALGGDSGTFGLIIAGLMVIAVAPVVEEVFFRGFFYRALRTRLSIWIAAGIDGLVFGFIHYSGDGLEGLLILPPLALLGMVFCLVYERTGSLFPVIGMHAFNNAVAYAVQADDGWQVSVVLAPLVLGACALAPRLLPSMPRPAPA